MEELHCTVQMSKVSKEYNFLKITVLKKWCEEIKSMLPVPWGGGGCRRGGGVAGRSPLLGVTPSAPLGPHAVKLVAGAEQKRSGFLINVHQMAPAAARRLWLAGVRGLVCPRPRSPPPQPPGAVWQEGRGARAVSKAQLYSLEKKKLIKNHM